MRVLHIIKSLGRGGAEVLLAELLRVQQKGTDKFVYIYFLPWKNQLVEQIESLGGIVINIPARNVPQMVWAIPKVVREIRQHQIEIIHAHLPWAGIIARIAAKWAKVPLVYTEHNKQERYHWLTAYLNKVTFKWNTRVIAVSKDVALSIHKNISVNPSRVTVIENGVDIDFYRNSMELRKSLRAQFGIPENVVVIGNVCVFRAQKRLDIWVKMIQSIQSKFPDIKGVLVGDGILGDEIRNLIRQNQLESSIVLPGLQTGSKNWLAVFDIFLMTSEFEGMPVALLEAMSMSNAVVCTDAGGISEIVQHNVNGFLVPFKQPELLETYVEKLIINSQLRVQFGLEARSTIAANFSINKQEWSIRMLYHEILTK